MLPCLRKQNKVIDTRRYGTEKLSSLLPKCRQDTLINVKDSQVTVIKHEVD